MSNNDILGPFFLNCLMLLLKVEFDLEKINMTKTMFKDENVVMNGFVVEVGVKVKSYYRWMTGKMEKVVNVIRKEKKEYDEFDEIVGVFGFETKQVPGWVDMAKCG